MVGNIHDNLLQILGKGDCIKKCLYEAHKTESMIEQCKMLGTHILSAREGLKAMAITSTDVGAGLNHVHGEIASIVLLAANPSFGSKL